ncbi:twin-arginine translocation signal domain-containing protein [Paracoccaceae bacterium GXU_MW_L88]
MTRRDVLAGAGAGAVS